MSAAKSHLTAIAIATLMVSAIAASTANSATINVGDHLLIPNRAGQTITIMVSGGEQVSGLDFCAQIGDGGPELDVLDLPAGTDGPAFAAVDLKTGTIFNGVSSAQTDNGSIPQVVFYSIVIGENDNPVAAAGKLATLTIDTTGFSSGNWDLLLKNVLGDPYNSTNFPGFSTSITNGSISIAAAGDSNRDGLVNTADAIRLAANWLSDDNVDWAEGDFNADGRVDDADAAIMAANWSGPKSDAAQSVPEPPVVALLGLIAVLVCLYSSRRPGYNPANAKA